MSSVLYGLIGKDLSHSFSRDFFEKKFAGLNLKDHSYENFELEDIRELPGLLAWRQELAGLNVTHPYKEQVMQYLDEISGEAKEIGAVNCVKITASRLTGYNTDAYGFSQSIKPFLDNTHHRALILGTGGASKAVAYALKKTGVQVYHVTSSETKKHANTFFYSELNEVVMSSFLFIVNTTPLGMFPLTAAHPPIPFELIGPRHFCYDLIYNPGETFFLQKAREMGAQTMNGLSMLHLQAEKSWEIWKSEVGSWKPEV